MCSPAVVGYCPHFSSMETKQSNPGCWQRPSLPTSWARPMELKGKTQVRMHRIHYTNSADTILAEHEYDEQAKAGDLRDLFR